MEQGFQAGDYTTSLTNGCAKGVDCSGFVSRIWASGHQTTSSIPGISGAIAEANLKTGDVFNLAGHHVVMFESRRTGGYDIYESTTSSMIDRVIYRGVDASYVNGYSPRRYNNACP